MAGLFGALGKGAADDPVGVERVELRLRQTQLRAAAHRCAPPAAGHAARWIRSGPRENRIGNVLYREAPITGWSSSSKKPRAASCGRSGWSWGCITLPTGTPASQRTSTMSSADRARHHAPRTASMRSCARIRPALLASSGSAAHSDRPARGQRRVPLLVGGDRDGDPSVVPTVLVGPSDLVEVLRRRRGPAVPGRPSSAP